MVNWIESIVIQQSIVWSLLIVFLVSFFESLALVGLILPGAILMASLGAMIGSNQINLYPAWIAGFIGCLLGDWISYYLGWQFKKPLNNWVFLKKYKSILSKIKSTLYKYSTLTIIIGRFIGHTRPLIPLIAGMTGLPSKKFIIPNIIGCFLWPPLYFIPGILAGVIIDIPKNQQNGMLKWLFFIIVLILWIGIWLCWKWKSFHENKKQNSWLKKIISINTLKWIAPLFLFIGISSFIAIQFHPMMQIFRQLLWKIFIFH